MSEPMGTVNDLDLNAPPEWAQSLIVAEFDEDQSDAMTDYFNTRTTRTVALAWSRHDRDIFSELRKAAALLPETAHLGPGRGIFGVCVVVDEDFVSNGGAYWKGARSHWHRDIEPTEPFWTRSAAEACIAAQAAPHTIGFDGAQRAFAWHILETKTEHREKYSMGHGYYLKAGDRYSSGWVVRKYHGWVARRLSA